MRNTLLLIVVILLVVQIKPIDFVEAVEVSVDTEVISEDYVTRFKVDGLKSPYDQAILDDILWIGEYNSTKLWKFNITDETASYIQMPENITPLAIRIADDRSIWFIDYDFEPQEEPDNIVRYDPVNNSFDYFELPSLSTPLHLEIYGDRALVSILNQDLIWIINTDTFEIEELEFACDQEECGPSGLGYDSEDNLWITDTIGNRLTKYDNKTREFTFYDLPRSIISPTFITIDENDMLFTGTHASNIILEVDLRSMRMREYIQPQTHPDAYPTSGLSDVEIAPSRDIWVAEHFISKIGRIHRQSGTVIEYIINNRLPLMQNLYTTEDKIWFTEEGGYISYIDLDKVPTIKISEVAEFTMVIGVPKTISFDVEYLSGMYDEIEFDVFGEVRKKNQFRFFGDTEKLSRGERRELSLSVLITSDVYYQNYTIVYGINSTNYSATQKVIVTIGEKFIGLLLPIPIIAILVWIVLRKRKTRRS